MASFSFDFGISVEFWNDSQIIFWRHFSISWKRSNQKKVLWIVFHKRIGKFTYLQFKCEKKKWNFRFFWIFNQFFFLQSISKKHSIPMNYCILFVQVIELNGKYLFLKKNLTFLWMLISIFVFKFFFHKQNKNRKQKENKKTIDFFW